MELRVLLASAAPYPAEEPSNWPEAAPPKTDAAVVGHSSSNWAAVAEDQMRGLRERED